MKNKHWILLFAISNSYIALTWGSLLVTKVCLMALEKKHGVTLNFDRELIQTAIDMIRENRS